MRNNDIKDEIRREVDEAIADGRIDRRIAAAIGRVRNDDQSVMFSDHPGYEPYRRAHRHIARNLAAGALPERKLHAAKKGERGVIEIYEPIDEDGYGVSAMAVVRQLNTYRKEGVKDLDLRISSPGGSVFEAITMYARLQEWPGDITVYIDSVAASAASIVAMVGNTIKIGASAAFMIHRPWTIAIGNDMDFEDTAELLRMIKRNICKTYTARTGLDEKKVMEMVDALPDGTWLEAEEAVAMGFADEVVEPTRVAASFDVGRWLALYQAPANVVEKIKPEMSLDEADGILAEMMDGIPVQSGARRLTD